MPQVRSAPGRSLRIIDEPASASTLFRPVPLPERLSIPCAVRRWTFAEPVRARPAGTQVTRGEPLTFDPPQLTHAPLAPEAGIIVGVGRTTLPEVGDLPAIFLQVDPRARGSASMPAAPRPRTVAEALRSGRKGDLPAWVDRLRLAGINAHRWGSPDLIGQLTICLRRPADTVICSLLDADSRVGLQESLAQLFAFELAVGAGMLSLACGAMKTLIPVAGNADSEVWSALRRECDGSSLRLVSLSDDYPNSHPTLLIRQLTGRLVRPDRLPAELGVVFLDAATAIAIGRFVLDAEPMLSVPLGVYDAVNRRAHFLTAALGTPLTDVLRAAGVPRDVNELRAGNPLRLVPVPADATIGADELTICASLTEPAVNPEPCIRCAWCAEGCPVRLQPALLLDAAQHEDTGAADAAGLGACLECGICSYVCPSRLPLLSAIRSLKR